MVGRRMDIFVTFIFALVVGGVSADYECLCSYQVETEIFTKPDPTSAVSGYMYEFDCKPTYKLSWIDPKYQPIGNEQQLGFIELTSQTQIQTCQGNIPITDAVPPDQLLQPTTSTLAPTSTTTLPTTPPTTPIPTTATTTPRPTTHTTTPIPTTATTTPRPTTHTTTPIPTTTTTTPRPTTHTTTPIPTTTTTTPRPTTHTTTPIPTTPTTVTTTPMPTTVTTTLKPTTITTTPRPTTSTVPATTTPKPSTTPMPTTKATTITTTRAPPATTILPAQGNTNICPSNLRNRAKPENVFQHGKFCYEFVPETNGWIHAEYDCMNKNGVMLFIEDQSDQDFVFNMLTHMRKYEPVWLGLHDITNEEHWEWVSDAPLKYTNWMPSRFIDQYHDQEDCVLFVYPRKGQWDDVFCSGALFAEPASHPWICQYNTTISHTTFG